MWLAMSGNTVVRLDVFSDPWSATVRCVATGVRLRVGPQQAHVVACVDGVLGCRVIDQVVGKAGEHPAGFKGPAGAGPVALGLVVGVIEARVPPLHGSRPPLRLEALWVGELLPHAIVLRRPCGGHVVSQQSTGAWPYNRPCAQQYVGKSQSCMVITGRLIVHAPVQASRVRGQGMLGHWCASAMALSPRHE